MTELEEAKENSGISQKNTFTRCQTHTCAYPLLEITVFHIINAFSSATCYFHVSLVNFLHMARSQVFWFDVDSTVAMSENEDIRV